MVFTKSMLFSRLDNQIKLQICSYASTRTVSPSLSLSYLETQNQNNLRVLSFLAVLWRNPLRITRKFSADVPSLRLGFLGTTVRLIGPSLSNLWGLPVTRWARKKCWSAKRSSLKKKSALWWGLRLPSPQADILLSSAFRTATPNLAKKCGARCKQSNWTRSTSHSRRLSPKLNSSEILKRVCKLRNSNLNAYAKCL